jgi:hypothetical protein
MRLSVFALERPTIASCWKMTSPKPSIRSIHRQESIITSERPKENLYRKMHLYSSLLTQRR